MKLTVPERLKDAAYRLKDNKVIYCGLDDEMKDVVKLAAEQGVLKVYLSDGCKYIGVYTSDSLVSAYCLADDIEIVVKQEKTWWEKEGLILCEIEKQSGTKTGWEIKYPHGKIFLIETLGIPRCEGYEFVGFVHNDKLEKWLDIKSTAFGYFHEDRNLWYGMREGRTPSTATHTVWRKLR